MAATTTEDVLQSLIDTLDLCAEKIKGSVMFFQLIASLSIIAYIGLACNSCEKVRRQTSKEIKLKVLFLCTNTEGSLGQVMEDLELSFSLEDFWMKLGSIPMNI